MRSTSLLMDVTDKEKLLQEIKIEHEKNNHIGISEVFRELKIQIYYPNLQNEIHKFINNCEICYRAKFDRNPIKYPFNITKTQGKQNEVVHLDIWFSQRNIMYLTSIIQAQVTFVNSFLVIVSSPKKDANYGGYYFFIFNIY